MQMEIRSSSASAGSIHGLVLVGAVLVFGIVFWFAYQSDVQAILFGGAEEEASSEQEVVIAYSLALSNPIGTQVYRGMNMALQAHGEKVGASVVLVGEDTGDAKGSWDHAKEESFATAVAQKENVVAYIGPVHSAGAVKSMPILNEAGIAQIGPTHTWPGLTRAGFRDEYPGILTPSRRQHYIRVNATDDVEGMVAAAFFKKYDIDHVWVLQENSQYTSSVYKGFESRAYLAGVTHSLENVGADGFDPDTTRAAIEALLAEGKQVGIFILATDESIYDFFREDIAEGNIVVLGTNKLATVHDISGMYVTSLDISLDKWQGVHHATFQKNFVAFFGKDPDIYAAWGYEAMLATLEAIKRSRNKTADEVLFELGRLQRVGGVLGAIDIDDRGDRAKRYGSIYRMESKKLIFIEHFSL